MNGNDLTTGSIQKTIWRFAPPYFLSYFLQTLYGMADLYITGQFCGVESITAVSNGAQVMYLLTNILVGLAMGTTVTVGQAVGAKRTDMAEKAIGNTVLLFLGLAAVLTAVLSGLKAPIVRLIGTPEEAVDGTLAYLRITFLGIPFITAYNIISAIFRGLGDSKSPMKFIAVACGANIALDFLFIGSLAMGPSGAALGTVLAQTLSVVLALISILRQKSGLKLKKADFRPDREMLSKILRIGLPASVQDGCIQVAFMFITVIANHRGLLDAAAVGIVEKLIGMIFIIPSSMLATVSALSAQNIGAGKYGRATKILWYAMRIAVCYGIIISIVIELAKYPVLSLFTSDEEVVRRGCVYISSYIFDSIFAGIHFCFTGYFAACGKSYIGFLHNILAIVLIRVPGAWLMSKLFPDTLLPMGCMAPAGSALSVLICVIAFTVLRKKGAIRMQDAT